MDKKVIGVISDTHGLLRNEVVTAFEGCDLIVHSGDIGKGEVLEKLSLIAPVIAVRGNIDREDWSLELPLTRTISILDKRLYVVHDISMLDIEPKGLGVDMVIYGHSHKPMKEIKDGVIYLNPGSAGPRRFKLPVSAAILIIEPSGISVNFVNLTPE